jgi:hypothetical protein
MSLLPQVLSPNKSTYNPYNAVMVFGILWLQTDAAMERLFPLAPGFSACYIAPRKRSFLC